MPSDCAGKALCALWKKKHAQQFRFGRSDSSSEIPARKSPLSLAVFRVIVRKGKNPGRS
ncbi:unnamed protein product, partial [Nesidiocoris tenuis]